MSDDKKVCFVVMGYGKKTDFETQRTLDLDETYDEIIKPAVEECGYRCIRSNELRHSGIIDTKMYELLLRADLVVADISTANVNAIYELGVRHALRPFATIVIKEIDGQFHFDLNHLATLQYKHLGEEIGAKEARIKKEELALLIKDVSDNPVPDSPIYTYIPKLVQPSLSDDEYEALLDDAEEKGEVLSEVIDNAKTAAEESNHVEAERLFETASNLTKDNDFLIQQRALHRYKTELPSPFIALNDASNIISELEPEKSNDPETLGIAGAIYQRLFKFSKDIESLNRAIEFYKRGFDLRGDYYTGENAATCLERRSMLQENDDEELFDQMLAGKIRQRIVVDLEQTLEGDDFESRSDQKWVLATLSQCHLVLGNEDRAKELEGLFAAKNPADWEKNVLKRNGPRIRVQSLFTKIELRRNKLCQHLKLE